MLESSWKEDFFLSNTRLISASDPQMLEQWDRVTATSSGNLIPPSADSFWLDFSATPLVLHRTFWCWNLWNLLLISSPLIWEMLIRSIGCGQGCLVTLAQCLEAVQQWKVQATLLLTANLLMYQKRTGMLTSARLEGEKKPTPDYVWRQPRWDLSCKGQAETPRENDNVPTEAWTMEINL